MSRIATRTRELLHDDVNRMLTLFGTVTNTFRCLGISGLITYPRFYRAMMKWAITPEDHVCIMDAWNRWQDLYLRPEVPPAEHFELTTANRDVYPSWHPSAKPSAMGGKRRSGTTPLVLENHQIVVKKRSR